MSPRVAVLMPCHDDGRMVVDAVQSVREPEPVEIVVVDDASTDAATLVALAELEADGVRVVRLEHNVGVPKARTVALKETSAPYVFPLDSDDLLVPGSLSAMADRLEADPDAAACYGEYEEFGVQSAIRAVPADIDPYRVAYSNDWGAPLLRRRVLEEVGGWLPAGESSHAFPYEDWHVWMCLAERGERGVHMGRGFITYKRRIERGRRLSSDRRRHRRGYATLRRVHPELFANLRMYRRRSRVSRKAKLLYPLVYGRRPRLPFEPQLRLALDRFGLGPDAVFGRGASG